MPGKVGPLVDQLLRRSRDPEGFATTIDQFHTLLTHAQRYVALSTNALASRHTYTLIKRRIVYDIGELGADIGRVLSINVDGRDLIRTPWRALTRQDRLWLRKTDAVPTTWAQLGRNTLVIYPGVTQAIPVEIVYVPVTKVIDHQNNDLELAVDHHNVLLDFTEGLNMIRRREFGQASIAFARTGLNLDGQG